MTSITKTRILWWAKSTSSSRMSRHLSLARIWRLGRAHFREVIKRIWLIFREYSDSEIEWIKSSYEKRKAHVQLLLESLEHKDGVIRFTNARRLFYVTQGTYSSWVWFRNHLYQSFHLGTFAETSSPEHQLHWVIENCKVVRAANGISTVIEAIKLANSKHDILRYTTLFDVIRLILHY